MKKLSIVCVLALLLSLVCIPVGAASNDHYVEEMGVTVSVPEEYFILTRKTPANDPVFSQFNLTKDYIDQLFTTNYIYLNAITTQHSEEIVVTMIPNIAISDLSTMNNDAINALRQTLVAEYASLGVQVSSSEIYLQNGIKFIKVYFYNPAAGSNGLQFYTVYKNRAMNFTMHSYEGALTSRQENIIINLVKSLRIDGKTATPDTTEPTIGQNDPSLPTLPDIEALPTMPVPTMPVITPDIEITLPTEEEDGERVEKDEEDSEDEKKDKSDDDDDEDEEKSGSLILPLILIIAGSVLLIVAIVVVILVVSKKNKKPAAPPVYPYYAPPTPAETPVAPATSEPPAAPVAPAPDSHYRWQRSAYRGNRGSDPGGVQEE